jgi:hypothetical protein
MGEFLGGLAQLVVNDFKHSQTNVGAIRWACPVDFSRPHLFLIEQDGKKGD